MKKLPKLPIQRITRIEPTEDQIHEAFIQWVNLSMNIFPELRLLFHPPNGGYRSIKTAVKMKKLGVRAGVPDILLPVPRGQFIGLAIEFKRKVTGRISTAQNEYITDLVSAGWMVAVLTDADKARATVQDYLKGGQQWPTKGQLFKQL